MNTDSPFELSPVDEAEELTRLARLVDLSDGFSLIFALYDSFEHSTHVLDRLRAMADGGRITTITLAEPVLDLRDALRVMVPAEEPSAVSVRGLDRCLDPSDRRTRNAFLLNLNRYRDVLGGEMVCPLVLWVSEDALRTISAGAPDFYSIRSALFDFRTEASSQHAQTSPDTEAASTSRPRLRLQSSAAGTRELVFLHLSDLQFGKHHRFPQTGSFYDTLLSRLLDDLEVLSRRHGMAPNAVVISGDIAETGAPKEFAQARAFLDGLLQQTGIRRERVVLVPGNHDVNRMLCQAARLRALALSESFERPAFPKFEPYQRFFNNFYDGIPSLFFDETHLFQTYDFSTQGVLVAGLNSCMHESEIDEDHHGWIGIDQVRDAATRLNEIDPGRECLRLAVMHHNFTRGSRNDEENLWDADDIRAALEDKAGVRLILHGHRHIAGIEQRRRGGSGPALTIAATGSAGLDAQTVGDHVNQYQLIRIAADRRTVDVFMRQYAAQATGASGKGTWRPDPGIAAADGVERCSLDFRPGSRSGGGSGDLVTAREQFLGYVRQDLRYLPLRGFGVNLRAPIELQSVFISLRAMPSHFERRMLDGEDAEASPAELVEVAAGPREPEELEIGPALRFCESNDYRGLVVLGDPGCGKTTLLKYVALCLAQARPESETGVPPGRLPLFLPLREVEDFGVSLAQALHARYRVPSLELPVGFFEQALESERCLVLLDGLDEVATPETRLEAIEWIEAERKVRPGNQFVLTSRFSGYRAEVRMPGHYLEVHVRDFSDEQVHQFVRQWYHQIEIKQRGDEPRWHDEARNRADDLLRHLGRSDTLRRLSCNPLMLQITCIVHRTQGGMPRHRSELYDECLRVLLQNWDEAKGLEVFLTATEARQVLRPFALWLHGKEGRTFAEADEVRQQLLPQLERIGKQTRKREVEEHLDRILTSVRDRSGLFVGYGVTRYGFQHLSFQEFLAAEEMVKRGLHAKLTTTFGASWWREPTLLAVGLDDPQFQKNFFHELIRADAFIDKLDLALDCVREALAPDVAEFASALGDRRFDWRRRHNCAMLLREIGGPPAVNALSAILENPDEDEHRVIAAARDALIQLGVRQGELAETEVIRTTADIAVNQTDGTELIRIPAGEFTMGSEKGAEKPVRQVHLDDYWIARNPVTNAQYRRFIEATGHDKPSYWDQKRFNKPNQPVVGVTWHDAKAYCDWAGLELPTEAQWEKAARGTNGQTYPWGEDEPSDKLCNFNGNVGATTEVGSYPDGASPYGCLDMAGNVFEWCQDWYGEYNPKKTKDPTGPSKGTSKVLRGGCWYKGLDASWVRCAYRNRLPPVGRTNRIGFRCSRRFSSSGVS